MLKESLCVKWVNTMILGKKSIWEAKVRPSDSWMWKKTLWIKDLHVPIGRGIKWGSRLFLE